MFRYLAMSELALACMQIIFKFHTVCVQPFHLLENSGPPGDLYVCLDIEEPSDIKRDGINLYSTLSISYLEAILGTTKMVNFLFMITYCDSSQFQSQFITLLSRIYFVSIELTKCLELVTSLDNRRSRKMAQLLYLSADAISKLQLGCV